MKKKMIIGTSVMLLVGLFICSFMFPPDKDHISNRVLIESITIVPNEETVTFDNDLVTDDIPVLHEFSFGTSEEIPTLPLTPDGMIEESITVVPADDIIEDDSTPHSFTP